MGVRVGFSVSQEQAKRRRKTKQKPEGAGLSRQKVTKETARFDIHWCNLWDGKERMQAGVKRALGKLCGFNECN